jgi:hypothetical protein
MQPISYPQPQTDPQMPLYPLPGRESYNAINISILKPEVSTPSYNTNANAVYGYPVQSIYAQNVPAQVVPSQAS